MAGFNAVLLQLITNGNLESDPLNFYGNVITFRGIFHCPIDTSELHIGLICTILQHVELFIECLRTLLMYPPFLFCKAVVPKYMRVLANGQATSCELLLVPADNTPSRICLRVNILNSRSALVTSLLWESLK